jgi:hypothetical protein
VSFLVEPQNQDQRFVQVWPPNRQPRFGDLGLKIKRASVCRLCHKTDEGRSAWNTRRDLAACFTWKPIGLGFSSLASRLVEAQLRVVHVASSWRSCGVKAEDRRVDVSGCIGPFYPKIIVFIVLTPRGNLVF